MNLDFAFDDEAHAVIVAGEHRHVAPSPWQLLSLLRRRPDKLVARAAAMDALYGHRPDGGPDEKILDVYVMRLRRAIAGGPMRLDTVWGVGWRLVAVDTPCVSTTWFQSRGRGRPRELAVA
jgi:uroporphyrinogen-III synthase